ncbi:MAG: hypothetical protein IPH13_09850 [Planctomycetes bacterium]|nr:hypothetical protein [Planctomycetota bacterium]MCC7171347.1 hypothetical protein [Planctomycetota bacterium]
MANAAARSGSLRRIVIGTLVSIIVASCVLKFASMRRERRIALLVARAALVFIPLACSSVLLELALRWRGEVDHYRIEPTAGSSAESVFVTDPLLKWRYAPGFRGRFTHPEFAGEAFVINARGYRDAEWPTERDPNEYRVLVLGDSLTTGLGVTRDEAFPARLEATLAARVKRPVRVFNAGVSGYGPGEEALVLHELAESLRPNLVIVAFYDGNDLEDVRIAALNARRAFRNPNLLPSEAAGAGRFDPSSLWARRDPGGGLPRLQWKHVLGFRGARFVDDRVRHLRVRWFGAAPAAVFNDTMLASMLVVDRSPVIDENYALSLAAHLWMDARAKYAGARFVSLRLPTQLQVDDAQWEALVSRLRLRRDEFDVTLPGRRLVDDLLRAGVNAVDAAPVLRNAPGTARSYFAEGHPNRTGHARIAALLDATIGNSIDLPMDGQPR